MPDQTYTHSHGPWMIFLLAATVAVSPLAIDLYLPALPSMVNAFNTSLTQVQMTMSSYLGGFAIFHLACGPLADRFGRRPIILAGLSLFTITCFASTQAQTIEELISLRFVQGIGACCGPTLARSIVRDIYGPEHAAKALAYVAIIMAMAPAVAPTIGGFMLLVWPWSSMFYALGLYGIVIIIVIFFALPETIPVRQSLHPLSIIQNYWALLTNSHYMSMVLVCALLYGGTISFIAGASFVLIDMMGLEPEHFGFMFGFIVVGYMAGNFFCTKLSVKYSSQQTMKLGVTIALISGIILLTCGSLIWHPLAIMIPMAIYNTGMGIVLPHATAAALKPFAHMAGTASSLQGFTQMGTASLLAALIGLLLVDNPIPLVAVVAAVAIGSFLIVFFLPTKEMQIEIAK